MTPFERAMSREGTRADYRHFVMSETAGAFVKSLLACGAARIEKPVDANESVIALTDEGLTKWKMQEALS